MGVSPFTLTEPGKKTLGGERVVYAVVGKPRKQKSGIDDHLDSERSDLTSSTAKPKMVEQHQSEKKPVDQDMKPHMRNTKTKPDPPL